MNSKDPINILLVEDDDGHADLVKWNLEKAKIDNPLYRVNNGQKAIDWLLKENESSSGKTRPSLHNLVIILDINMPVMNGHEVLKQIRSHTATKHIPVMIFTTAESHEEIRRSYQLGCNLYIKKPDTHTLLSDTIQCFGGLLASLKTSPSLRHILYIEDDASQIALTRHCMERKRYDFTIDFARTGAEGMKLYNPVKHALVVIDYNLTDMDAPELAQLLKVKDPKIPCVFLSQVFTQERIDIANELMVKRCITKGDIQQNLDEIATIL